MTSEEKAREIVDWIANGFAFDKSITEKIAAALTARAIEELEDLERTWFGSGTPTPSLHRVLVDRLAALREEKP
jgi:hypothetical protein